MTKTHEHFPKEDKVSKESYTVFIDPGKGGRGNFFASVALQYAACKFRVIAGHYYDGGRIPDPFGMISWEAATADPNRIREWKSFWDREGTWLAVENGGLVGTSYIDIDRKNGRDGFQYVPNWRDLSDVVLRTPHGARLYFRSAEWLYSGTWKPGVEIFGNTRNENALPRFAIVPPSDGYQWIEGKRSLLDAGGRLDSMPREFWPVVHRGNSNRESGPRERIADWLPELPARYEYEIWRLLWALNAVPIEHADDHNSWVSVGLAIHWETDGSSDGLQLFDQFSQRSGSYLARDRHGRVKTPEDVWRTLAPDGSKTAGSIYGLAHEADPTSAAEFTRWAAEKRTAGGKRLLDAVDAEIEEAVRRNDARQLTAEERAELIRSLGVGL